MRTAKDVMIDNQLRKMLKDTQELSENISSNSLSKAGSKDYESKVEDRIVELENRVKAIEEKLATISKS